MKKFIAILFAGAALVLSAAPISTVSASFRAGAGTQTEQPAILRLRITAYTSLPDETDDSPTITAMGTRTHYGIVATNILPFGTSVKIPSLFGSTVFVVEDRMNRRMKNVMDVWMPTLRQAIVFGVNYADVVIMGEKEHIATPAEYRAITAGARGDTTKGIFNI